MNLSVDIVALAEKNRERVPEGFLEELDIVERALAAGWRMEEVRERGGGSSGGRNLRICRVVLEELRVLLCTEDERYAGVREGGRGVTGAAVALMAEVVAREVGVDVDVGTACVAFVAAMCVKVGVRVFCGAYEGGGADGGTV